MGNRAVITTRDGAYEEKLGLYLHWNGSVEDVEAGLCYAAIKGYREPEVDCYGWARLCQVFGNYIGGTLSLGIDLLKFSDTDNYDNGTYLIDGWHIVGKAYSDDLDLTPREELVKKVLEINSSMPVDERESEETIMEGIKTYLENRPEKVEKFADLGETHGR